MSAQVRVEVTSVGKRARDDDTQFVPLLASVVRASKAKACSELEDAILEAIETGSRPPSRAMNFRGPEFQAIGDGPFGDVELINEICYDRVQSTPAGANALKALRNCTATDEDLAHFMHSDGEILRNFAFGDCDSRIEVKRVVSPFNPVA